MESHDAQFELLEMIRVHVMAPPGSPDTAASDACDTTPLFAEWNRFLAGDMKEDAETKGEPFGMARLFFRRGRETHNRFASSADIRGHSKLASRDSCRIQSAPPKF